MSMSRPSLAELNARVVNDLGAAASLRASTERKIARSVASLSHSLHGHIEAGAKNANPVTSDEETLGSWASAFGLPRKQPTKSTPTAQHPATNGSIVEEGQGVEIDGVRFVTTMESEASGGSVTLLLEAETAGSDGNVDAGAVSRLVSPIAGITTTGVVTLGSDEGTDLESIADYRTRFKHRLRNPPRGGNVGDYEAWARATPGVDIRAVAVIKNIDGPGTMGIAIAVDGDDPIPTEEQVDLVQAYIEPKAPAVLRSIRVLGATDQPVDYVLSVVPDDAPTKAAVEAMLAALHAGLAIGESLPLSHINEAISVASGESDHTLTTPAANVIASTPTSLLTLGDVTFT